MVRSAFGFVFTATLVAVFLIVTGLMGFEPPAQISLDSSMWRLGTWSDGIVVRQVALGVALLIAAGLVTLRINRRLVGATGDRPRATGRTPLGH
jgi:hypothetical protein